MQHLQHPPTLPIRNKIALQQRRESSKMVDVVPLNMIICFLVHNWRVKREDKRGDFQLLEGGLEVSCPKEGVKAPEDCTNMKSKTRYMTS